MTFMLLGYLEVRLLASPMAEVCVAVIALDASSAFAFSIDARRGHVAGFARGN